MHLTNPVRRVAVIGAGPSGLAAVKYLLAEKYFDKIDVFEKRAQAGGVWNYCYNSIKQSSRTVVPQLDPNDPLEPPTWCSKDQSKVLREPVFISPLYSTLDTNIPKELMAYGDKAFSSDEQDLPRHSAVKRYLDEYAEDVSHLIQFETEVRDLKENRGSDNPWSLTTTNLRTRVDKTESYDAVVVASGHYEVPYMPDIPGIKEWHAAYPGVITHAKLFDSPEPFRGKKVIVVGSSASGLDIGGQISGVSKGKLLASQRSMTLPSDANRESVPEISEFLQSGSHQRAVRFADGRVEANIDAIVFCTGYFYSFPFLSSLDPPLITDGRRTRNTYQHLFYIYNPTLVLPALPQKVIPFPLSQNQAAVFARVWSGRLSLPSEAEMKSWETSSLEERGEGTAFHRLPFPLDADYMNMLYEWAASAEPRDGLENHGKGKQGNFWGAKERWWRQQTPNIRKSFMEKGAGRGHIKSLTQLGYDFDQGQKEGQ